MTTHIVADDTLGMISRRMWEVQRRLMEGTLDPSFVAKNLQLTAEGTQVSSTPAIVTASSFDGLRTSPFFANEEVKSNYGYPQGYAVKPVYGQLLKLSKHFDSLDTNDVLAYSEKLPALPTGAEGWFATLKWQTIAPTYGEAVEKVFDLIGKTRAFHNFRKGNLGPKYLRLSERTAVALQMLGEKQKGGFLLIPAQFGLTHRGRSVRRARVVYAPNEFGLGSFITGCMILSHPERIIRWEQLHINCSGDDYSSAADGVFSLAPFFSFAGGKVEFDAFWIDRADEHFGSASGFLPAEALLCPSEAFGEGGV